MTRTQIVRSMAEKLAVEPKQVQASFDVLLQTATEQTREAGEFTVPGLGNLVKAEHKERIGRNPQTGDDQDRCQADSQVPRCEKNCEEIAPPPQV